MADQPTAEGSLTPTAAVSAYGVMLTLVGAVLLALAYYGVRAIDAGRELGEAFPLPVYFFIFSLLFGIELLNSRLLGLRALARAATVTVIYGVLFVLAVDGGIYLWENPELALEEYVGLTVLGVALVVAVLIYMGYLTLVAKWG